MEHNTSRLIFAIGAVFVVVALLVAVRYFLNIDFIEIIKNIINHRQLEM